MNPLEFGEPDPTCPLCLRPIPPDVPQSLHHMVPRLKGGPVVRVHHICHKEIHARFTETELARSFHTVEALRESDRLRPFLDWVAKRPPGFLSRVPGGPRRRG
jgi:hypothetical protein